MTDDRERWALILGASSGMGEATSDTLVHQISPVLAVMIGFVGLVIALALQFAGVPSGPWLVSRVAEEVAKIKGLPVDEVTYQISANTCQLFDFVCS